VKLIRSVGRRPIERDTLYNVVQDYSDVVFEEDNQFRGYLDLPVVNN
jgi:aminodeoxyfutalosine synthase